jgi:hypothetical protein
MRILAALVVVGATMSVGCTSLCGSSCRSGKCSAETQSLSTPTKTLAAKPKGMSAPKGVTAPKGMNSPEVVPVKHEKAPLAHDEPAVPADHETVMPDGEPSASLVPPPPSAARLGEEDSELPSPAEIAQRSDNFVAMPKVPPRDDEWNESPNEEVPAAPAKPSQWSSRPLPSPPVGN